MQGLGCTDASVYFYVTIQWCDAVKFQAEDFRALVKAATSCLVSCVPVRGGHHPTSQSCRQHCWHVSCGAGADGWSILGAHQSSVRVLLNVTGAGLGVPGRSAFHKPALRVHQLQEIH